MRMAPFAMVRSGPARKAVVRAVAALTLALCCAVPVAGQAFAAGRVTGARIGVHDDRTRVVLDLTESGAFHAFTLPDPNRVVIDIPPVEWSVVNGVPAKGLVEAVRHGRFKPDIYRVVLDTRSGVEVADAFMLPPAGAGRYRLVVDIVKSASGSYTSSSKAGFSEQVVAALTGSAKRSSPPSDEQAPDPQASDQQASAQSVSFQTASISPSAVPTPRAKPGASAPVPIPRPRPRLPLIVVDPGHGGIDPGAIGRSGTLEKNVTLAAARTLRDKLLETGHFRVTLTRDRDEFIQLRERFALAQAEHADLFISLHADSLDDHRVSGLSVYTLSETASDEEAAQLARDENRADLVLGGRLGSGQPDLVGILIDLAQRETMNLSAHYAGMLVRTLGARTRLLKKSHRFAGFAVLKAPDVPSVLIELGFMSNRDDERKLQSATHLELLAEGIIEATERYFRRRVALSQS